MPLSMNELQAIRLLGTHTGGWFNIGRLTGDSRACLRSEIMSALNDVKTPKSKSGVTVMRERFYALAGDSIGKSCDSVRDDEFKAWAKSIDTTTIGWTSVETSVA